MSEPAERLNLLAPTTLGRSALRAGRVGIAASYGVGADGLELALEQGLNFFYWGSIRRESFGAGVREIARRERDRIVVALQSYDRTGLALGHSTRKGLRELGIERADVLILGWWNGRIWPWVWEAALQLKAAGLVKHLAVSSHERTMFAEFAREESIALIMARYNAAHRGAETDVFPQVEAEPTRRVGVMTYTSTRWGHLVNPKHMPPNERTPSAADCYRFALTNPGVDIVLAGPRHVADVRELVEGLRRGPMDDAEVAWMRRIGDFVKARRILPIVK